MCFRTFFILRSCKVLLAALNYFIQQYFTLEKSFYQGWILLVISALPLPSQVQRILSCIN